MVKWFLLTVLCSPLLLEAMAPKVRAEVNSSLPPIKGELQGILSFYHSPSDQLENLEAQMSGSPLPLTFLYSAPLSAEERALYLDSSSSDLVSVYRFPVPLADPGIYPLPSIAIKVGKQWVQSIPSNYQIQSGPILPFLQLQAFISPSLQLFPGQRAKFVYRITYNNSMDLTVEDLPLLEAKGFEKIGSERIEDMELSRATTQEITQEVRASKPGNYLFEKSHIEGKVVAKKQHNGQSEQLLQDSVASLTVQVLPFPKLNQPFFFNGALAPINIQASLLTRNTVRIGDYCKIAVDLTSTEETVETLSPPELNCQPNFAGFFRIDSEIQMQPLTPKTRRYIYYLHPLSYHLNAIPAIEVAAFDPQSKTYVRARSLPIPLHIQTVEEPLPREVSLNFPNPLPQGEWRMQLSNSQEPLNAKLLLPAESPSTWTLHLRSLLLYTLCGCIALFVQTALRPKWLEWRKKKAPPLSLQLLRKGQWEEALLHRLYETKWITSPDVPPEKLTEKGIVGKTREFLLHLEAARFSASAPPLNDTLINREAHQLYSQIMRPS